MKTNQLINIHTFLEEKNLVFQDQKQAISWVRRNLKPVKLLKVGPNYLSDKNDLETAFQNYLTKQRKIYDDKVQRMLRLREKMKTTKQTKKNDKKTIQAMEE